MEKIKNLLEQIAIIRKKNNEILDATGGRFNIFRVCGVNHYENTHSAIIAEFLNPDGTHGLKSKLLECFIQTLKIKDFNSKEAIVYTEYSVKDIGRLDILLKDNQNKAIIIENKIYADDQEKQLKRYDDYAKSEYKNGYQVLYLTLNGKKASKQSGEGVNYLQVSYEKDIIKWLEKCVLIASRYPMVRETIIQYINHLKILTNQDMDANNTKEIIQLLAESSNLQSAKYIYNNYSKIYNYIAKTYFNPKMQEFVDKKGNDFSYVYNEGYASEYHIRFEITNKKWKNFEIGFTGEPNNKIYYYGLKKIGNNVFDEDKINKLREKLDLENKYNKNSKDAIWLLKKTDKENSLSLSIKRWQEDIMNSDKFFENCKEKITELLKAIEEVGLYYNHL